MTISWEKVALFSKQAFLKALKDWKDTVFAYPQAFDTLICIYRDTLQAPFLI
ncbi:hypothetical protein [Holospora elegans]|uniref:hypothetical protein n=1 Tax=Holospora elegans TaxID=431043 RepID=UPI00139F2964|nr:hypothetical protein [Holospora elegans]